MDMATQSGGTTSESCCKSAPMLNMRPWWRRGGMHFNEIGMIFTIAVPLVVLVRNLEDSAGTLRWFVLVLLMSYGLALLTSRTIFCVLVVPTYMVSLLLVPTLDYPVMSLLLGFVFAVVKGSICMSVCLHRYAAHAAFKAGPIMQWILGILGCLANQGGPIWWASHHRCHHKYCDLPRDPHAAIQVGTERAFAFFQEHPQVEEEFSPVHCDGYWFRVLDTFSSVVVATEYTLTYALFGRSGLFVAYTSSWVCQTMTLWFNVANHPEEKQGTCKAANYQGKPRTLYLPFLFLDMIYPVMSCFVGETQHEDHHEHSNLAFRDDADLAYYLFVYPLEKLGLIWNVKTRKTL